MTVSIPLCVSSRETVSSHGPPSSPYLARTGRGSMPGRKCDGVVPSGTTRTSGVSAGRPKAPSTERARSAVQRLFATTTDAPPSSCRAVHHRNRERRIFASSSSSSVPCTITP